MKESPAGEIDQLLSDELVAEYLENHPDFFNRHQPLLQRLSIVTPHRGALSLIERQMELLRQKNRHLEEEITSLLSVASHNETLYQQYADLFLALFASRDISELHQVLVDTITGQMGLSRVVLKLYSANAPDDVRAQGFELEGVLSRRLQGNSHYFGRLNQEEQQQLFGQIFDGSVALIALGDNQDQGLLAIASSNAGHFHPGMDPLLLNQLCRILGLLLNRQLSSPT